MTLAIATHLNALMAQRLAARAQGDLTSASARLSSGLRINSARDDAAGLAIADRFTAQIRGTNQAARNANDAISLSQTAEGALGTVSDALQRIRELAVQAASATNSSSDRRSLQLEVAQLVSEVDRIAAQTQFNGVNLLDGSFTAQEFQVGANRGQTITVSQIASARSTALGQFHGIELTDQYIGWATINASDRRPLTVTIGTTAYALGTVHCGGDEIVAAINAANVPGLSATVNPTQVRATVSTSNAVVPSGTAIYTLYYPGGSVAIPINGLSGLGNMAFNRASAVAAINAQTAVHGCVATDEGPDGVSLSCPDGRSLTNAFDANTFTGSNASNFGLRMIALTGSTVNVTYVAPEGATGNVSFVQGTVYGTNPGFTNSTPIGSAGKGLAAVDVSTMSGATAALTTVDAALGRVAAVRAGLGAVQNRFASAINALGVTGENLGAARSRIQDADFAMEMAQLSRAEVLQQAGTAMVAQANQLPQRVLALLR